MFSYTESRVRAGPRAGDGLSIDLGFGTRLCKTTTWSSPIDGSTLTNQCGHLATKIQVRIGLDMIRLIR